MDDVRITHGTVANKTQRAGDTCTRPRVEGLVRRKCRRFDGRVHAGSIVNCGEHFTSLRIHPRRHRQAAAGAGGGQSIEGGDGHDPLPNRHREALHRRNPDSESRERSRANGNGEQVQLRDRSARGVKRTDQIERQPRPVSKRWIADEFRYDRVFLDNGHAAAPGRGVERED